MKTTVLAALTILALSGLPAQAQDARAALDAAAAALGTANLRSVQYVARGSDFVFGQLYDPNSAWPRFNVPGMTLTIDYTTPALLDDRRRTQAENPPLGGGFQPILGEQRQIWALSGAYAWDVVGQNAVPGAAERDFRSAVTGRSTQIWLTPHGFVKAALASGTATSTTSTLRGSTKTIVTFTSPTGVRLEGTLNEQHLVERITTWVGNPVMGDVLFEAILSDYRDVGGMKFPMRIVQREGGYPVLDITVTEVKPNAPLTLDVPASIRQAAPAPAAVVPEQMAEGVWMLPGAAKSVLVEFRDHLVVIDAPETEARSVAVLAAIRTVSKKPIRWVVNTHLHFDHAGGLRTYAAEGAAVVTHRDNIPYYQQVWSYPRTVAPDRLSMSGRTATFEPVVGSRVFTDGARTMVVYHYAGNMHNPGMLMVHLPKERILVEADSYTAAANPSDPPGAVVNLIHFADTLDRLRLEIDQIIPIHGPLATPADIRRAVDQYRSMSLWGR